MKYELTDETKVVNGITLHRIRCVKAFGNVKVGDLGGWIEGEKNLSQDGNAWVYDNALVYSDAYIKDNARICGNARVYECAKVCGNARVYERAKVYESALVHGGAQVYGDAIVCGRARVFEYARVHDNAVVYDDVKVCGDARVCGNAEIRGDAVVKNTRDYAVYKNSWSSGRNFTYTASNKKWKVGCFYGTGKELIEKAYHDSQLSGQCYEAIVRAQEAIDAAKEGANE